MDRTEKIISFLKEIEKFKTIERKMYCSNPERAESDAEHSWHLAMFLLLFRKDLPEGLDFARMLKLALVHDLAEIYAGDVFIFDEEGRKDKKERESESAKILFSALPDDLRNEFISLFEEYENNETPEAKIIKSLDKIQPILQNICSGGKSWKEHGITISDIEKAKRKDMEHSELLTEIYERLLRDAQSKGLIK